MVQLSHPYMTTGKTIAFILWTFVSKAMLLLFNREGIPGIQLHHEDGPEATYRVGS